MPSMRISGVRCASTERLRRWLFVIITMIVRKIHTPSFLLQIKTTPRFSRAHACVHMKKEMRSQKQSPSFKNGPLTIYFYLNLNRSHRQRLRPLQIRRFSPTSLRHAELPLVRSPTHLLRIKPRHRFPRSLLSTQFRRRMRSGRVLQFHSSETTLPRIGEGIGVVD